ncbi:unnamed protein product, partial [Prorocentrum cordatum]
RGRSRRRRRAAASRRGGVAPGALANAAGAEARPARRRGVPPRLLPGAGGRRAAAGAGCGVPAGKWLAAPARVAQTEGLSGAARDVMDSHGVIDWTQPGFLQLQLTSRGRPLMHGGRSAGLAAARGEDWLRRPRPRYDRDHHDPGGPGIRAADRGAGDREAGPRSGASPSENREHHAAWITARRRSSQRGGSDGYHHAGLHSGPLPAVRGGGPPGPRVSSPCVAGESALFIQDPRQPPVGPPGRRGARGGGVRSAGRGQVFPGRPAPGLLHGESRVRFEDGFNHRRRAAHRRRGAPRAVPLGLAAARQHGRGSWSGEIELRRQRGGGPHAEA